MARIAAPAHSGPMPLYSRQIVAKPSDVAHLTPSSSGARAFLSSADTCFSFSSMPFNLSTFQPPKGAGFCRSGEPASASVGGADELSERRELYNGKRKPESKECRRPEKIGKIEIRTNYTPRCVVNFSEVLQRQKKTPARTLQGAVEGILFLSCRRTVLL